MPLSLVQDIDNAFNELVKWKIDNVRRLETKENTGSDDLWGEWTPYPKQCDIRIRRLSLSPICLALVLRLGQLQAIHNTGLYYRICIFPLILILARFSSPMMPFHETYHLIWLVVQLPAISFKVGSRLVTYAIYLDAFAAPIVGHLLKDVSDREEFHYICIGVIFFSLFDTTMLAFYSTLSLFWTLAIGVVAIVAVQVAGTYLAAQYWDYYPTDFVRKQHSRPPFYRALLRFSNQRMIFRTNRILSQLRLAIFRTPDAPSIPAQDLSDANLLFAYFMNPHASPIGDLDNGDANNRVYSRLLAGNIRLLKILPGRPSDTVRCQFVKTPLTLAEPYEAVSYVWGTSTEKNRILVNDTVFSVTASAYRIIRDRRSWLHERLIWIDQVCINQKDLLEKANQIRMMKTIFSRASLVTAWLGPAEDAHHVQSLTADLYFLREGRGWSGEEIRLNILGRYNKAQWTAMTRFFKNPWFHRTWILQEVASASRLHVMYGNICMDWTYVGRAVAVLFDGPLIDFLTINIDGGPQPLIPSNVLKIQPAAVGLGNGDTMLSLRGDIDYRIPFTMSRLMEQCKFFDSSDKRDKVFSLLGLATDGSEEVLIPDYIASPCSVYIKTMRHMLTEKDPLYCLSDAGISLSRTIDGLPSWVPDWSIVSLPPLSDRGFNAGMSRAASVRFDEDLSVISLDGVKVDCVDSKSNLSSLYSPPANVWEDEWAMYFQKWFEELKELAKGAANLEDIKDKDLGLSETVFRTILADHLDYGSQRPLPREVAEGYATLEAYFAKVVPLLRQQRLGIDVQGDVGEETLDLILRLRKIHFMLDSSVVGRRFCITANGRMAIVPDSCEVGDLVCIFGGAKLPCLLREAKKGTREGFQLVGSCYVHGIMSGEIEIENPVPFMLF